MQNATPRIDQDARSRAKAARGPAVPVQLPTLQLPPYDRAAADALVSWRPGIKGDPRSCDIMDLYRLILPQLGAAAAIAEVGVAWGRCVVYAASLLAEAGSREARVYAVDPWRGPGDPGGGHSAMHFDQALRSLVVSTAPYELDIIYPLRAPSPAAAAVFTTGQLDLVLIDGCHVYESVLQDLAAWTRVVRAGGILAGHDYTDEFPGVQRAVDEVFGARRVLRGTCWVVELRS